VKPRRLGDWKRIADRAHRAVVDGEWWDGKGWRPHSEHPRDAAEGHAYRTAHDVLDEAVQQMTRGRQAGANLFGQSVRADRNERSASTAREADAEMIFNIAKPLLPRYRTKGRTAWTALAVQVGEIYGHEVLPNRLRMLCRQRGEK
jgi:hypothetical protein